MALSHAPTGTRSLLVLARSDVEALLDPDSLVDAVAAALRDLSAGVASMPARVAARVTGRDGLLGAMPAFLPSKGVLAAKLVTVFPANRERPSHQALVCCFDPVDGTPVAVMDGTAITAARTAAGSALATRLLARRDARVVAIVGTGPQAAAHARAFAKGAALRLAGRDPSKVAALATRLAALGVVIEPAPSVEDAVRSADIVCAATHARTPVVRREWLKPGTHVNSVGYDFEGEGEVDADTIRDARVFVESRAAALAPPPAGAPELRRVFGEGGREPPIELGELLRGTAVGRTDDAQLTLYKSVGVAVEDAAAAAIVLEAAARRGLGTRVEL